MLGNTDSKNLLKTSYSVSARSKATAEWNHNVFNAPRIYGSFTSSTPSQLCALIDNSSTASTTSLRSATELSSGSDDYTFNYAISSLSPTVTANNGFKFSATVGEYFRISFYAKTSSSTADKIFLHFSEYSSSTLLNSGGLSRAFQVDNVDWSFHEILIAATNNSVSNIHVDFTAELVATQYSISDITVVKVPAYEWTKSEQFKVKDTFSGFRPGDEIAENNISSTLSKIIYQTGQTISTQYIPGMNTLSYFTVENSGGVYAIYDKPISTNKIVVKLLNGSLYTGSVGTNYEVQTYSASTNSWTTYAGTTLGAIRDNGSLILYWNGSTWSTTETASTISSDGKSLSGITTIDGLAVKVSSITSSASDLNIRFLEVSPRLLIDISDYVVAFNVSKELDSGDIPLPVGVATSNSASLELENLPRLDSGSSYFSIFSDQSSTTPLANILKRDVKVRVKFDMIGPDGLNVESNLPLFVGYVDSWNVNDSSAEVNLFDYAKYLQNKRSRDILLLPAPASDNTLKNILTQVFEQNGFSDYSLPTSLSNIHINSFYIDRQKTIWECIQELLMPYQYMAYFNNLGTLVIKSYNDLSSNEVSFKLTDIDIDGYISNINSFTVNKKEKPSEVKIRYNTVSTKFSATSSDKDLKDSIATLKTAPDKVWEIQEGRALGYTKLKNSVSVNDKEIQLDTTGWGTSGIQEWSDYSGYLVLNSEIMKYDGIEVVYSLDGTSTTAIVKSQKEYQKLQNDVFEAQKSTGQKTLTIRRTGKLVNVERGLFGTAVQSHTALASLPIYASPGNPDIAGMYVYTKAKKTSSMVSVTGRSAIVKSDYHGANKDTVIRLESVSGNDQTMLAYDGDSNSFDTYEFIFAYPKDMMSQNYSSKGKLQGSNPHNENDYMGIFFGVKESTGKGIFIEFPLKSNKVNKKTAVYLNKASTPTATCTKKMDLFKSTKKTKTELVDVPKTVKKKKGKKTIKVKTTVKKKKKIQYQETYFKDTFVKVVVKMKGKKISSITVDGVKYKFTRSKKAWSGDVSSIDRNGNLIGIYAGSKTHVNIQSIKAYNSKTSAASGSKNIVDTTAAIDQSAQPVGYTAGTVVRGADLFEVEFNNGPAYAHTMLKPDGIYSVKNSAQKEMDIVIAPTDTEISQVAFSPYRAKFFIQNTSDHYVPIYTNSNAFGVRISANILTKSEEIEYSKKILDNNQTSNIIDISSDWIQTEENAKNLMRDIDKFVKLSMDTYSVEVFGNPLIEIGDMVNMYYYQSGITDSSKYIVTGVEEEFDGGFTTSLTLRKIAS